MHVIHSISYCVPQLYVALVSDVI